MQATEHIEVNTGTTLQVRELVRMIVDAATALARLLPDKELEQRFEFAWGHSNSLRREITSPAGDETENQGT